MTAFDHLVIHSFNPKQHKELFSQVHQLQGTAGGKHDAWGTHNHLAFMQNDCYIEWLGVDDETIARSSENPLIQSTIQAYDQKHEGPFQFALRVNHLDDIMNRLTQEQVSFAGPFPGQRTKPDGSELAWRMLFPMDESLNRPLPFLIEWDVDINRPGDSSLINQRSFSNIEIGVNDPGRFLDTLAIIEPSCRQDDHIILDNGQISVDTGNHLVAQFEHITFK
ncbi:VOC family protein [Alkalibacillus almallahensis]|uniref:VOC family protein n=1 Tax=Alkalibacillus almallahensis TaxID=1379154 RepID=UPI001420ACD3|nr:hypothetical protein [Alkalibacillus almallahensis]